MEEALYRAEEYRKAGADAILIHSRQKEPSEIKEFCQAWGKKIPVVIVPTTYGVGVSKEEFYDSGASLSIWANHNMRASVAAMRNVSNQLFESEKVLPGVERDIAPVKDIFSLMNEEEMSEAELKYTPARAQIKDVVESALQKRYFGYDYTPNGNISPDLVVSTLIKAGSTFFAGVPDSLLKSFCRSISESSKLTNVVAANEGTAVSLATGHYLATSQVPVVYMQNSGLGNAINPLLSLVHHHVYGIPMVVFVGWRGEHWDEPQHMVQGGCMQEMIIDMGFDCVEMPACANVEAASSVLEARERAIQNQAPVFVVVKKDTFCQDKETGDNSIPTKLQGPFAALSAVSGMSRLDAVGKIDEICPKKDWVRICTTGKSSRELYDTTLKREGSGKLEDMLVVGSMGHASSIAQGICLGMLKKGVTKKRVLCIDGDGAVIMHMGALTQAGQLKTPLLHVVLNNGTHESVGMERTAAADSTILNLTEVARASGYVEAKVASNPREIEEFVKKFENATVIEGPWMLEVRVGISDPQAPLPRPVETPAERKAGVMHHIQT